MELFRVCMVAIITAVCCLVLKANKSDLVPLCLLAGGILILLYGFDYLTACVSFFKTFMEDTGVDNQVVRLLLKLVGIAYLFELTASSVKDLGFSSLGDKLLLCGKLIVFVLSIPVFKSLYECLVSLINLS